MYSEPRINFYCSFIAPRGVRRSKALNKSECFYQSLGVNEFKALYIMTDTQFKNFTLGKPVTIKSDTSSAKWVLKKVFIII
jgi:hypothetical protein